MNLSQTFVVQRLGTVLFPLDEGAERFAVVLYHDKAEQFGPANFIIHSIDIRSANDEILC
ncbi:unnamed protein product [Strongylus vulgaris]|uniref:Uncharacterized protein n=1 Tax=Strongylus vulgaris TaxID=40348 RepID=A0A3P7IU46_STRVU|nr:unnamed protein product [Strongylus vulgaris]